MAYLQGYFLEDDWPKSVQFHMMQRTACINLLMAEIAQRDCTTKSITHFFFFFFAAAKSAFS